MDRGTAFARVSRVFAFMQWAGIYNRVEGSPSGRGNGRRRQGKVSVIQAATHRLEITLRLPLPHGPVLSATHSSIYLGTVASYTWHCGCQRRRRCTSAREPSGFVFGEQGAWRIDGQVLMRSTHLVTPVSPEVL